MDFFFSSHEKLDSFVESWTLFIERLQQYFFPNVINDADCCRAIFVTVIGPFTHALLRNLISPDSPTAKTLDKIIDALNAHFDPAPYERAELYKFNNHVRWTGESIATFIAELRSLARQCNYSTSFDEA